MVVMGTGLRRYDGPLGCLALPGKRDGCRADRATPAKAAVIACRDGAADSGFLRAIICEARNPDEPPFGESGGSTMFLRNCWYVADWSHRFAGTTWHLRRLPESRGSGIASNGAVRRAWDRLPSRDRGEHKTTN
jgi:hypothetical protein